jgi:hypothetical protein
MLARRLARIPAIHHALFAVLLVSLAPVFAHADSILHAHATSIGLDDSLITFTNTDGKAGTMTAGGPFMLQGSSVNSFDGTSFNGKMSFSTGNFITSSGSLATGGMFAGGGSFTITSGSTVVFSGGFSGDVSWVANGCSAGLCTYTLTGPITGTYKGQIVSGATTQLTFTTSGQYTGGFGESIIKDKGGVTSWPAAVPEPGSLGLMGTGLIGIAAGLKRKLKGALTSGRTNL